MIEEDRNKEKTFQDDSDPPERIHLTQATKPFIHKKEDSTSNTQKLEESSFDISPNSSGVMLLEQITEIKRLFEIQGRELDNVGQVFSSPNTNVDRMKEIMESIKIEPAISLTNSVYGMNSLMNFHESSRQLISPVPNEFEGSLFASSLMSMSDYQIEVTNEDSLSETFIYFLRHKWRKLEISKKCFFLSHIPSIRI